MTRTITDEQYDDLHIIDSASLDEFRQTIEKEVIPEIVKMVKERQLLAEESRRWFI